MSYSWSEEEESYETVTGLVSPISVPRALREAVGVSRSLGVGWSEVNDV